MNTSFLFIISCFIIINNNNNNTNTEDHKSNSTETNQTLSKIYFSRFSFESILMADCFHTKAKQKIPTKADKASPNTELFVVESTALV